VAHKGIHMALRNGKHQAVSSVYCTVWPTAQDSNQHGTIPRLRSSNEILTFIVKVTDRSLEIHHKEIRVGKSDTQPGNPPRKLERAAQRLSGYIDSVDCELDMQPRLRSCRGRNSQK